MVVDSENNEDLRQRAEQLRPLGVEVELGVSSPPERVFSLAVWSQTALKNLPLVQAVRRNKVPLIGELELGYQHASCLSIAIAAPTERARRRKWSTASSRLITEKQFCRAIVPDLFAR